MHLIKVCQGETCRKNFAEESLARAEKTLGIRAGETTHDGQFRLEKCGCLSHCEDGPNVLFASIKSPLESILLNGQVENHMLPSALEKKLLSLKQSEQTS